MRRGKDEDGSYLLPLQFPFHHSPASSCPPLRSSPSAVLLRFTEPVPHTHAPATGASRADPNGDPKRRQRQRQRRRRRRQDEAAEDGVGGDAVGGAGGAYEEDEIESSDGGAAPRRPPRLRGGCSDSDDNYEEAEMLRQRLVRTGPRADSLDVEAQDVAGMNRHQVRAPARAPTGNTGPCLKSAASTFVRANCSMYCLRVPDTYQSWSSTLVIVLD